MSAGPIRVEVEAGIDDAHLYQGWIEDRNPNIVEALPAAAGHEQWVAIEITGTTYEYRVNITIMRDGHPLGPSNDSVTCECNSATLLLTIDKGIAKAVEQVKSTPETESPPEAVDPPPTLPPPRVEPEQSDSSSDIPRQRRMNSLGYAGIGVGVLGAGMLGGGVYLMLLTDARKVPMGVETRPTQTPGILLTVGGGVAMATGVSLLIIDLVHRDKSPVVALPAIGPRFGGVSFEGRF